MTVKKNWTFNKILYIRKPREKRVKNFQNYIKKLKIIQSNQTYPIFLHALSVKSALLLNVSKFISYRATESDQKDQRISYCLF